MAGFLSAYQGLTPKTHVCGKRVYHVHFFFFSFLLELSMEDTVWNAKLLVPQR